ncbi:hypothetical protein WOLCODRAFT_128427 [Wolfiporia cocos MD-104 SS10]|uniref:Cytosine-purine permease n=1 Tax=Wolfiporia cocos (strain MD-104) TaxID=742152 RepID=A0A2H3JLF8_WOLCO|nr:hypothetical protein WOLCODRAFT_128427 [Wolfiporia cocos MD-104 SS10]
MKQDIEKISNTTGTSAKLHGDVEKQSVDVILQDNVDGAGRPAKRSGALQRLVVKLAQWGVETNGIAPTPAEKRADRRLYQLFFVWFSANLNILTLTNATVGPAYYGLGVRDSLLVILFVDTVTCTVPAFFGVFGPKLGTRCMVQARFSWGYYGALIPSILVTVTLQGYLILNTIIGGQTLASISKHLNASLGIVIISLATLVVVFSGYKVLHWFEMFVWIPNVVAFVVMLGVSGKHLTEIPLTNPSPIGASAIMTYGAALAASVVNWSPLTPDQGVFHDHKASTWRVFIYSYLGLLLSIMPVHMLGASFTAGASYVPAWKASLGNGNDIGGLLGALLQPAGGFGKFLVVLLALTSPSQCAPAMYTVCNSFMSLNRVFARIPRFLLACASTAIIIPVAIVGSSRFYAIFSDILSFIGYWLAPFAAIVLTEHFVFRRNTWAAYEVFEAWNTPRHPNLPPSYVSTCTFVATIGFIVVCMQKDWWTGPLARKGTGDVGMLLGFFVAIVLYTVLRGVQSRWSSRRLEKASEQQA